MQELTFAYLSFFSLQYCICFSLRSCGFHISISLTIDRHGLSVTLRSPLCFPLLKPGATNGIGKETARVLALRGAKVIIPARTLESGQKVKESLADQVPSSKLHVMEMDLSSLSSVRNFVQSFTSSHEHLNILMYVWSPMKRSHIQNLAPRFYF